MYGAILGDIIGSPYEFDQGNKRKDFPLFSEGSMFTDDTVMTIAVAEGRQVSAALFCVQVSCFLYTECWDTKWLLIFEEMCAILNL
jgi:ADP-ribosylglycohydrolase